MDSANSEDRVISGISYSKLSDGAIKFLTENIKVNTIDMVINGELKGRILRAVCDDGVFTLPLVVIGYPPAQYASLNAYVLINGQTIHEKVQYVTNAREYYLALAYKDGTFLPESLWPGIPVKDYDTHSKIKDIWKDRMKEC